MEKEYYFLRITNTKVNLKMVKGLVVGFNLEKI